MNTTASPRSIFPGTISRLLATTALGALTLGGQAHALPTGGAQQGGAAGDITINAPVGGTQTIDQTTDRGVINWTTFDIGAGEHVHFNQATGAGAATLNRVTGDVDASQINGQLTAPGEVVVVNPNGVVFGPTGDVDVSRLIATSADVSTTDFLAGDYNFTTPGAAGATVELKNGADIKAADGGVVALIAPNVKNAGVITANQGSVLLAAGQTATLDFHGDGLINFATTTVSGNSGGNNAVKQEATGQIKAGSGKVYVTANAAAAVVDQVVNLDGVVEANSLVAGPDGEIAIVADGNVKVKAPLQAQKISIDAGTHKVYVKNVTAKTAENTKDAAVSITGAEITVDGGISAKVEGAGAGGGTGNVTLTGSVTEELNGTEQKIEATTDVLIDGALKAVASKDADILTHEFTSTAQTLGIYGGNSVRITGTLSSLLADLYVSGGTGGVTLADVSTGKDLSGLVMDQNLGAFAAGNIELFTSAGGNITTGVLTVRSTGNPQYTPSFIRVNASGNALIDAIDVLVHDLPDPGTAYTFNAYLYGANIELLHDLTIHSIDNQGRYREASANLYVNATGNVTFGGDVTVLTEAGVRFPEDTGSTSSNVEINAGGDIVGHNIGARALGGDYAYASVCINACRQGDDKIAADGFFGNNGKNVTLEDVAAIAHTSLPEETPPEPEEKVEKFGGGFLAESVDGGSYGARGYSRAKIAIYGQQSVTTDDQLAQAYGGTDARSTINNYSGLPTGVYPVGGPPAVSFWIDQYGTNLVGGSVTVDDILAQAVTGDVFNPNFILGYGFGTMALATVDLSAGNAVTTGDVTASSWDNYDAVSYVDVESNGTVSVGSLLAEANTTYLTVFAPLRDSGEGGDGDDDFPLPGYTNAQATVRITADGTNVNDGSNITYNGADPRAKANDTNRQGRHTDYEASPHAFSQLILADQPDTPTVPGGSSGGGGSGGGDTPIPPGGGTPTPPGGGTTPPTAPGGGEGTNAPGTGTGGGGTVLGFGILEELLHDYDNGFFRGLYSYFGETLGNPYYYGNTNVNLTLLANGGGNSGGGFSPAQLGNLAPAAGGSPEQLGQLSPAAGGGNTNNAGGGNDGQCGNNFLDGGYSQQYNAQDCNEEQEAF